MSLQKVFVLLSCLIIASCNVPNADGDDFDASQLTFVSEQASYLPGDGPSELASAPNIARWTAVQGSGLSLLKGRLDVRDGCIILDNGGTKVLPVFPYGRATWDGQSKTLIYLGRSYHQGDIMEVRGRTADKDAPVLKMGKRHLPSCDEGRIFLIYN